VTYHPPIIQWRTPSFRQGFKSCTESFWPLSKGPRRRWMVSLLTCTRAQLRLKNMHFGNGKRAPKRRKGGRGSRIFQHGANDIKSYRRQATPRCLIRSRCSSTLRHLCRHCSCQMYHVRCMPYLYVILAGVYTLEHDNSHPI
jgi:hypothetical protein